MLFRSNIFGYKENVFVKPIKEEVAWEGEKIVPNKGIISFSNKLLESEQVCRGQKVAIRKHTDYKFHIFGDTFYKMKNQRILAKLD